MALENAKHLRSVTVGSPYVTALPNAVFQIKNLKFLSMSRLNCEALPDAISDVWSLQALHITDSQYLLGLPESIGKLKKLRTLNLSGCQYLNRLPDSIGDCHMISNIDLWRCIDLTVLPNSIGRNKELRVLRLGCTGLRRLPSIITLENLECLDLRWCHELVELPEGIWNLKKLEVVNLKGYAKFRSQLVLKGRALDQVQNMNIIVVGRGKRSALMLERYIEDLPFAHTYATEPDDAHMTCLKQKTNLQGLNLRWMAHDTAEVNNEFDKAVLDDLEPPSGIKELGIRGYSGRQSAWWMQSKVGGGVQGPAPFPFLRVINLIDFPNLKHLHGLVELPCLEELELKQMPSLESISGGPFPSLVNLEMHDLPCLGEVWMVAEWTMHDGEEGGGCYNFAPQLGQLRVGNCLIVLKISDCPKLEVKPHLPSLQHMKLSPGQCEGSSSSPSFSDPKELRLWNVKGVGSGHGWELLQHMTALESLEIINFSGVQTELPESLFRLTSLRSLKVDECSNIYILPESLGELRSLQELTIKSCPSLTSLPQSMVQLTSLRFLVVEGCKALQQLPDCLGELCSLCKLEITDLQELTCLPQSICRLTSLRSLEVDGCFNICVLPESLGELWSLQELTIKHCNNQSSLPQSMGQLTSLQELVIESCEALHELPYCLGELCSLRKLLIRSLPRLTCLPQSMCRLTTSLQVLKIYGCPSITSLPQGMEGLVSLEKLSIWNCLGLTSLPQGMEGLVSLEELSVCNCPGIQSLPEGIKGLSALKELWIFGCPDLERQCERGKGEDWHLISHIPDVDI